MKVFIISDTHFSHSNIIKYCNRPFESTEEMDKTIIKNWNKVVSGNDVVIHLGDVGLGSKEKITEIVKQLNGKKILIRGNHDRWTDQTYIDMGFSYVSRFPILYDQRVFCSHAPIDSLLKVSDNLPFLVCYGHIHTNPAYQDTKNSKCCCVERLNYTPFLLYEK